eukprot:scaffold24543_cov195-Amphora_coffeaeformis.AAC.8
MVRSSLEWNVSGGWKSVVCRGRRCFPIAAFQAGEPQTLLPFMLSWLDDENEVPSNISQKERSVGGFEFRATQSLKVPVLTLYKLLDPSKTENEKNSTLSLLLMSEEGFAAEKVFSILSWLDFLGMDTLLRKYDKLAAQHDLNYVKKASKYPPYINWLDCKRQPFCPLVQRVRKEKIKYILHAAVHDLSRPGHKDWAKEKIKRIKTYLLDDHIGYEMWQYLLSKVDFPEDMIQEMDRDTIVKSPFFKHILEISGRSLESLGSFNKTFSDIVKEMEKERSDEAGSTAAEVDRSG